MDDRSDKRASAQSALARCFPYVGWAALGIASLLAILQAALALPSGYGIEEFLGFTDSTAMVAAYNKWDGDALLRYYAIAYLAIDLALFVPLYAVTSLCVGYWLDRRLHGVDSDKFCDRQWLVRLAAFATAALVPIDVVETTIGLVKLGEPLWGVGTAALGIVIIAFGMRFEAIRRSDHKALGLAAAIALVGVVLASFVGRTGLGCGGGDWWHGLGCVAHRAKEYPIALMFLAPLAGVLLWLSGLQAPDDEKALRVQLRMAIGDIFVRSRYVLTILVLLTFLLFFGGQSRDYWSAWLPIRRATIRC